MTTMCIRMVQRMHAEVCEHMFDIQRRRKGKGKELRLLIIFYGWRVRTRVVVCH